MTKTNASRVVRLHGDRGEGVVSAAIAVCAIRPPIKVTRLVKGVGQEADRCVGLSSTTAPHVLVVRARRFPPGTGWAVPARPFGSKAKSTSKLTNLTMRVRDKRQPRGVC
jgi:hypothetical protein